ncbi:protein-disulfide reductase DsbD domain-containing protein [Sphingomonas sp.]|uniref:protein-disulfide reductase DsbD family protein n=1 Tax=Sphingomonas sp. TaxID=28214 RepID=UPI00286E59FB|nr:protein-disulfide reductase DsbD domain-containing protein [Sphingomonas sp.]
MALLAPASAAARENAIRPELVAEGPARPGGEVELAIVMRTRPGWHGYWQNPGDAGLPMRVDWQLPPGVSIGPLRYPVPTRLTVAGLMNYVYERDYAILARLKVPPGATGQLRIAAKAEWLACTDKVCVPECGDFALNLATGGMATMDTRFDDWRRALPRPLATPAAFALAGTTLKVAIPLPRDVTVGDAYVFPLADGPVDYAAAQSFRRVDDMLVAELPRRRGEPTEFAAVLALGDGRGLEFRAVPGTVPDGGSPVGDLGLKIILLAMLGALTGGVLLNLMPCVFPILALKALHLARSGGAASEARRDALAYTAGAVVGTGALGAVLLAIRAGGSAAGWAFQLQDPRTTILLMLLSVAIALNLVGLFVLPALAGRARPSGGFATGALAAFVATPCAGPFLGAALGTALLLPAAGSVLVFAALGLGLAIPLLLVAFVPGMRSRVPAPGRWMERLQRFLAIPMAATAVGCLWLLYRQGGRLGLEAGILSAIVLTIALGWVGWRQRRGLGVGIAAIPISAGLVASAVISVSLLNEAKRHGPGVGSRPTVGTAAWSEDRVAAHLAKNRPVFVYFTADWCLTCKVNEATAINRAEVRRALDQAGVKVLAGDWTNGDPAITRFLDNRARAGVPLYLWYAPSKAPEELPQILTPGMLVERARQER